MRLLRSSFVLYLAFGCTRPPEVEVCCFDGYDGTYSFETRQDCLFLDGEVVADELCEDPPADTDSSDTDSSDTDGGSSDPCGEFCLEITVACPEDEACLESCGHSTTPPGDEHIACAQAATSCAEASTCWSFYSE